MKIKKTFNLTTLAVMLISLVSPMTVFIPKASAVVDTCTWTGGGADNNFNTSGNWSGCTGPDTPESGDSIVLDMSTLTTQSEVLTNDIVGLSLSGVHLTGTPSSYYDFRIIGSPITLAGDITGDQVSGSLVFAVDVVLGANVEISAPENAVSFGYSGIADLDLDLQTYDLLFSSPSVGCGGLSLSSSLAGSGDITTATGTDGLLLDSSSGTFTGSIVSNGAGVSVNYGALSSNSTTITINGSGNLTLVAAQNRTFPFNIVMNSTGNASLGASFISPFGCVGAGDPDKATLTVSGNLTLQRDTIFNGTNDLVITGTYTTNSHALTTKTGSVGSITTSAGTIEPTAVTTTVNAGDNSTAFVSVGNKVTLILNGERGNVSVGNGGILKGTGRANQILVWSGGILAPGLSPGCITATSGLILEGTYQVEIAGKTVCTEYDQADVTGAVSLTDGTLSTTFLNNFVPALNDTFMIIKNDSTDAVTGTFTGLAQGATFVVSGVTFQISYTGGDGNDVVLTATAVPATVTTPDTGVGSIISNPIITLLSAIFVAGTLVGFRKLNSKIK